MRRTIGGTKSRLNLSSSRYVRRLLLGTLGVVSLIYLSSIGKLHFAATSDAQSARLSHIQDFPQQSNATPLVIVTKDAKTNYRYQDWRKKAVDLAMLTPDQALLELDKADPFEVRTFEERLKKEEVAKQRVLTMDELKQLFPCPISRISLPEQRDLFKAKAFREGKTGDTFLLFQHLRKAGGTNFCTLANNNLPPSAISSYYCMPDMFWHEKRRCAGCLKFWSNADIIEKMKESGYRIQGNEWHEFEERFFDLPATLVTSFRQPLDRILSQYRFECVEGRQCEGWDMDKFRNERDDLVNIYTRTFNNAPLERQHLQTYLGTSPEDSKKRGELMGQSLDNVVRFHLVMVMEWLAYSQNAVSTILGFNETSALTQRVRPHIEQAKREDGQEINKLGAASITKASWDPKERLTPIQFKEMSEKLVMDKILTDAARRIFLERLVCPDVQVMG